MLVDFSIGGPRSVARGRSSTRRGRLGHEAWEGSNRGTRSKGGRLRRSRQGSALLRRRGCLHHGPGWCNRRVVRDSGGVATLGLLAAIRRGDDLVRLPLAGRVLLAKDGWHLSHGRMAHLLHSVPVHQSNKQKQAK